MKDLETRVTELEEQLKILYSFLGNLPEHVAKIEHWRSNETK